MQLVVSSTSGLDFFTVMDCNLHGTVTWKKLFILNFSSHGIFIRRKYIVFGLRRRAISRIKLTIWFSCYFICFVSIICDIWFSGLQNTLNAGAGLNVLFSGNLEEGYDENTDKEAEIMRIQRGRKILSGTQRSTDSVEFWPSKWPYSSCVLRTCMNLA